jgi:hypothetical protein
MKNIFSKVVNYLKKHRTIIFCVIIVLLVLSFFRVKVFEGLTNNISEYAYLAPITPEQTAQSDLQLEDKFYSLYPRPAADARQQLEYSTKEEIEYYVQNKKFPYGSYVSILLSNYLSNPNENNRLQGQSFEDVQKIYSSRSLYGGVLYYVESNKTPPPKALLIFTGKIPVPTETQTPHVEMPSPHIETPTHSQTDDSNYQKFISLCKTALAK